MSSDIEAAIVAERKAFDETKAGVKGLVDSGITSVPRIFDHLYMNAAEADSRTTAVSATFPIIDLQGVSLDATLRSQAIHNIIHASQTWGFFQVVNHGIPIEMLDEARLGARAFFEQDLAVKQTYYTRNGAGNKVVYNSNFNLHMRRGAADWRDTFNFMIKPNPLKKEELPEPCREPLFEYGSRIMDVGKLLLELISIGLGLAPDKLLSLGCMDGLTLRCQYYPPCPEPEKTMGTTRHKDNDFITLLLQGKEIGGLQVVYENQWINVPTIPGALVVNIGNFLQLMTNDKLKSVEHRVLANKNGPKVSIVCFFNTSLETNKKILQPIPELLSEDNPPIYQETTIKEYNDFYRDKGLDATLSLSYFKI